MPPIAQALLLHGAGGGGWEWAVWRGVLEAHGIAVAAPDLQPAASGLTATLWLDYQQQVRQVLDVLPRPRALIGASLGGLLAMACSDACDALVLVNPLPPLPWSAQWPAREWPDLVPWQQDARLVSTRRAIPDADDASALYAFRHWRDESGAVLRAAQAGIEVTKPACPVLCVISERDEDVPPVLTRALADACAADVIRAGSPSHVGPLFGREAGRVAAQVADWLSVR